MPRQKWKVGRIIEPLPSKDCKVRGCKVLVGKTGQIVDRPVNKLYPIELANYELLNASGH